MGHARTRQPDARQELLKTLYRTVTREFSDMPWDALLQQTLLDYVQSRKPRVLFVGYGETDEWGHKRPVTISFCSPRTTSTASSGALDDDAVDPAVQGPNHVSHHDGPWPRRRPRELEAPRLERGRRREHVDSR